MGGGYRLWLFQNIQKQRPENLANFLGKRGVYRENYQGGNKKNRRGFYALPALILNVGTNAYLLEQ